jgi:endonuclease-3 related protein
MDTSKYLLIIYEKLDRYFGDLHWWPGETPFEIIVGAILTQNTSWENVTIAINNLKSKGLLYPEKLIDIEDGILAELIKPSGYYNVKTKRLKAFLRFLRQEYELNLEKMFEENLWALREKMLDVNGIGEETADSILLYAGNKPIFVVDLYTRRILQRHETIDGRLSYGEIQKLFMNNIPNNVRLFNQYHALLVNTGKHFCRKGPRCEGCPLEKTGAISIP